MLQVECHPYLNQAALIKDCEELGVIVTAYSPLGSPDRPWAKPGDPILMEDPKLVELAKKYEKTVPQILLRYQVKKIFVIHVHIFCTSLGNYYLLRFNEELLSFQNR